MRKMISFCLLITILVIILTGISGCNYGTQENISEEVKIGLIADLTGTLAMYGQWVLNGVQIAMHEIKEAGQINNKTFSLIIEDSQTDPKSAVNAMRKLVNVDKVKLIISGNGSSSVMGMAPIANNKRVILFVTVASSPSITSAGDYVFRNRISGLLEITEMAKLITEKFNLTKVAVAVLDNEAGHAYIKAFTDTFIKYKGKVLKSVLLATGESDFRSQVAQLKEVQPEAVFYAGPVKEGGYLIKQATEIGLKTKWLSISPIQSEILFEIAGDAAEGLIFATEEVEQNNPKYLELEKKYQERYGELPTIYSVNGYDAIKLLYYIIEKEGYNADKIQAALYSLKDYIGAGGVLKFDSNGDVLKQLKLKIVKNRTFEILHE